MPMTLELVESVGITSQHLPATDQSKLDFIKRFLASCFRFVGSA